MGLILRTFNIDEHLWEEFKEICEESRVSMSSVIRILIKMFVDGENHNQDNE